ncbi:MAG: hypothetical protein A2Z02_06400 [Chloroflexi bacterium RBG_16_48_7]|nr:MAG: hypothetical protein A2Z02_06400 [Chloroflexi bacterium RBG_16_48_7]
MNIEENIVPCSPGHGDYSCLQMVLSVYFEIVLTKIPLQTGSTNGTANGTISFKHLHSVVIVAETPALTVLSFVNEYANRDDDAVMGTRGILD